MKSSIGFEPAPAGAVSDASGDANIGLPVVYVVDDDTAMRSSLCWLIESVDLAVLASSSAEEFLGSYDPQRTACLVLDVRMPKMSGLDLQVELTARCISIPILMITGFGEVPVAVKAMKAGAFDFLEKPFSDQVLLDRIRAAIAKDAASRQRSNDLAEASSRLARLTGRQREILDHIIAGKSNKAIAHDLGLSSKTVEVHRAQVMKRLDASSVADLVRIALRAQQGQPSNLS
jgi:two-component system response regulator FixJ